VSWFSFRNTETKLKADVNLILFQAVKRNRGPVSLCPLDRQPCVTAVVPETLQRDDLAARLLDQGGDCRNRV
jgi:hypothetical protein